MNFNETFSIWSERKITKWNELDAFEEKKTDPLGPNRLVFGSEGAKIDSTYQEWFIHQAILLSQAKHLTSSLDPQSMRTKNQIDLSILHGYAKAASLSRREIGHFKIQVTPILSAEYHRSSYSDLLRIVHSEYAKNMSLKPHEVQFIHSFFFREVLDREFPVPDSNLDVTFSNEEKFENLIEKLLSITIKGKAFNQDIIIDFSNYLIQEKILPHQIKEKVIRLEEIFWKQVKQKVSDELNVNSEKGLMIWDNVIKLRNHLQLVALTIHQEQCLILTPDFLKSRHEVSMSKEFQIKMRKELIDCGTPNASDSEENEIEERKERVKDVEKELEEDDCFVNLTLDRLVFKEKMGDFALDIEAMISRTGYRIGSDEVKAAWLKLKDVESILKDLDLPVAKWPLKKAKIPIVFNSYQDLLNNSAMLEFRKLKESIKDCLSSHSEPSPYLSILSDGAVRLLDGLNDCCKSKGGMDKIFEEKGLTNLLQISYFRLINAVKDATLRKNKVEFYNQLEIIHQIIQDFLAIAEPYEDHVFEMVMKEKLTEGKTAIIPSILNFQANLMSSGMHCVSSAIASVEAQKNTNQLNVVLLKDSYYESTAILEHAKTHNLFILNGDQFNATSIEEAFVDDDGNPIQPPNKPIDLFLCEFHHNISEIRVNYQPENITAQVKAMVDKKMVADQWTVIIDTTMNLEKSEEIRQFFFDKQIMELIQNGKLNVVLVRSTQKFDMLGMDNYHGGIAITINHFKDFEPFNKRMSSPKDQLRGLSYHGLTHLQKYGQTTQDNYRRMIMKNTKKLYQQLPKGAIYKEGSKNPMQISQINDPCSVFLDIKFVNYHLTGRSIIARLKKFAEDEDLPLSNRASFGFPNSNFVTIGKNKYRLTQGLEDEIIINRYGYFFHAIQEVIEITIKEFSIKDKTYHSDLDKELKKRIDSLPASLLCMAKE